MADPKYVMANEPAWNRDRTIKRNDIYANVEHAAVRPIAWVMENSSREQVTTICGISACWVVHRYGRLLRAFDTDGRTACPRCVKKLAKAEADGIDLSRPRLTPTEKKLWQEIRKLREKALLRRRDGLFGLDSWGYRFGPFRWATYKSLEAKGYIKTEPGPYGSHYVLPISEESAKETG